MKVLPIVKSQKITGSGYLIMTKIIISLFSFGISTPSSIKTNFLF